LQQSIEAETARSSEALKKSLSAVQDRLKAVSRRHIAVLLLILSRCYLITTNASHIISDAFNITALLLDLCGVHLMV